LTAPVAISRVRPNNNVTTKDDKASNTGRSNDCFGPIFHGF